MNKKWMVVLGLIGSCLLLVILPLQFVKDSEFGGSDGEAEEVITEILGGKEYEPWISPLFEPPGAETESLLFCLQAAIGAGGLGYCIGTLKEKYKRKGEIEKTDAN